eukprot:CAMPEP_0170567730 /NCGR_PEP_ID=MMETSP0211-20121228/80671_1 /TAXON_ID=311385 /ORGANISM="Pseudokeronopsis sp., Strain OXSARD2" /LENGTH=35 /DNA_ID= /DNA_START= /DNA_END= /DNA_ORIENTATION=
MNQQARAKPGEKGDKKDIAAKIEFYKKKTEVSHEE